MTYLDRRHTYLKEMQHADILLIHEFFLCFRALSLSLKNGDVSG